MRQSRFARPRPPNASAAVETRANSGRLILPRATSTSSTWAFTRPEGGRPARNVRFTPIAATRILQEGPEVSSRPWFALVDAYSAAGAVPPAFFFAPGLSAFGFAALPLASLGGAGAISNAGAL